MLTNRIILKRVTFDLVLLALGSRVSGPQTAAVATRLARLVLVLVLALVLVLVLVLALVLALELVLVLVLECWRWWCLRVLLIAELAALVKPRKKSYIALITHHPFCRSWAKVYKFPRIFPRGLGQG